MKNSILATLLLLGIWAIFLEFGVCIEQEYDDSETERIVGGKDATNGMYPWTVALYYEGAYVCTGSIISERAILTAAHCLVLNGTLQDPQSFHGTAGNVNRSSSKVEYINFARVTIHPQYSEEKNDVAVLETLERIPFSPTLQPICIASPKNERLEFKKVVAMGWGQINMNPNKKVLPEILQFTSQRVVTNLKCSILYYGNPVPRNVLCARGLSSGICYGDSGGPLVLYKRGKPIQVGVASYVNSVVGCGKFFGPAAFARVSSYTKFITNSAPGEVCVD